jgi:hypothetical protein
MTADQATRPAHRRPWWESLQRNGENVPDWVQSNLRFYNAVTKRSRVGFYVIEVLVILTSATIPAAAAAGASTAVAGILGACVTALIGLRQLTGWREAWARYAQTRAAIEREVVLWSRSIEPYSGELASADLVQNTEALVAVETDRWASLRLRVDRPAPEKGSAHASSDS